MRRAGSNDPYHCLPKTGLIATIKGKRERPIIGLRADIDALPVTEVKDLPFKSQNKGVMHACGHDSHMAMLLGAARTFSQNRDLLNGTVRLIFQPAEEVIDGAKSLLNVPEVMECDNLMAIHIFRICRASSNASLPKPARPIGRIMSMSSFTERRQPSMMPPAAPGRKALCGKSSGRRVSSNTIGRRRRGFRLAA